MERTFPVLPIGDEIYYYNVAVNLAKGRGHIYEGRHELSRAWRPPAQSFLLSQFVDWEQCDKKSINALWIVDHELPNRKIIAEEFLRPMVIVQAILSTLLIATTALLGYVLFNARIGIAAGFVAAFYPTFIGFSHYLWSEMLFAVLISGALALAVYGKPGRSWLLAALTGVVFGMAGLTREISVVIAGVTAIWWVWSAKPRHRRAAMGSGALMLAMTALVILPWSYRNYTVLKRFVPVTTVGWFAAAEGNTLESPNWYGTNELGDELWRFRNSYFSIHDEGQRMDFARKYTLERIRQEQPAWIFKKLMRNLAILFSPDSSLLEKIRRGAYGSVTFTAARSLLIATVISYIAVIVFGVLGVASARGTGRKALPCLLFAVIAVTHVLTNASPRFRVPWMPVFIVYASYCVLNWRTLARNLRGKQWIAPLVVLLFFFGVCAPYFYDQAVLIWSQEIEGQITRHLLF